MKNLVAVRERRVIMLGAVAMVAIVSGTRGVPKAATWFAQLRVRAEVAQQRQMYGRALLAEESGIRQSMTEAASRLVGMAPRLLEGPSAADAHASLAGIVGVAATRSRVRVARIEPLQSDSTAHEMFIRVGVTVEVHGDISGVSRFVGRLETGSPALAIKRLLIVAPAPEAAPEAPETLRAELTVTGWTIGAQRSQ